MKKSMIMFVLITSMLVGCQQKQEVVPVVQKFDPAVVLAKPPASAMTEPVEPSPLQYGSDNATNSAIMKKNNLDAANDRAKLITLQQYIRDIFNPQK